jgi:hypothetical protein
MNSKTSIFARVVSMLFVGGALLVTGCAVQTGAPEGETMATSSAATAPVAAAGATTQEAKVEAPVAAAGTSCPAGQVQCACTIDGEFDVWCTSWFVCEKRCHPYPNPNPRP